MKDTPHNDTLWQAKLHARLHDPAEKALVLLRDPAGHEGGTVRELHARLFPDNLPDEVRRAVKHADWWASAADRPQFPIDEASGRFARWTQVRFDKAPLLKHPLSGHSLDLRKHGNLSATEVGQIKRLSLDHFRGILDAIGDDTDRKRLALALWRFGPELSLSEDDLGLGELWRFLPADTRVPDHSIWDHLDLTAAFAGAFAADDDNRCALLSVSLGPVQPFIAAARTASDLWAGSHLLSRMAWEAMKVIASELGPDSILFPRLRGIAQVDLWLNQDMGLPRSLFENAPWLKQSATDANPLFSAALPNRFVAVVPADRAQALAERITDTVRDWARNKAHDAFERVLDEIGGGDATHGHRQIDDQMAGFPEVHWSIAPYSDVIRIKDAARQTVGDTQALADCLAPFFETHTPAPGFLGSQAWALLSRAIDFDGARFYEPNPGVLYPAVHQLADRSLSAAKSGRTFAPLTQHGYRCTLTGTDEWLTDNPDALYWPPGQRQEAGTLWTAIAEKRPAWARKGEHLGALATLKRLWPTLFVDEIATVLEKRPSRFVVSTHAMALAPTLRDAGQKPLNLDERTRAEIAACDRSALPRRLVTRYLNAHPDGDLIARLPSWLESIKDTAGAEQAAKQARRVFDAPIEGYYALILMDGDHMGQWLSGDPELAGRYRDAFHPDIENAIDQRLGDNPDLRDYLDSPRALSPNRHLAISGALGDFASVIARRVVEDNYMGRLLYAGGDDVMAMMATSDLLPAMAGLRGAYSGRPLDSNGQANGQGAFDSGFYHHGGRLYLTMGHKATASMGAVIAHHQAPLGHVQRVLKAAEQQAKSQGRDRFCLHIIKRSGGDLRLTLPWSNPAGRNMPADQPSPIRCLQELSEKLGRDTGASRRAAYNVQAWLEDLPEPDAVGGKPSYHAMLASMLHHAFQRQGLENKEEPIHSRRLAHLCPAESAADDAALIGNFLSVAEFMARECRSLS